MEGVGEPIAHLSEEASGRAIMTTGTGDAHGATAVEICMAGQCDFE